MSNNKIHTQMILKNKIELIKQAIKLKYGVIRSFDIFNIDETGFGDLIKVDVRVSSRRNRNRSYLISPSVYRQDVITDLLN